MSTSNASDGAFQYNQLSGDIHELVMLNTSQETLEKCFNLLGQILKEVDEDQPLLMLSDVRQSGLPPIGPFISLGRRLFQKYPTLPPTYNAVLHGQEGLMFRAFLGAIQQLARLTNMQLRFFSSEQRSRAIIWLLEHRTDDNPVTDEIAMKSEASDSDGVFQYTYLPEGIHELVLLEANQAALEQCFARLDLILTDAPIDQPILLISDTRQSGVPPVGPLVSFARRLFYKHHQHPVICDAILHHQEGRIFNTFLGVVQQLAGLYRVRVRFFQGDAHHQAVRWLLTNRNHLE